MSGLMCRGCDYRDKTIHDLTAENKALRERADESEASRSRLIDENQRLAQDCARIASERACEMVRADRLAAALRGSRRKFRYFVNTTIDREGTA